MNNQPVASQPAAAAAQQQPVAIMPASRHSAEREPGKEHIPLHPKGFIAIRILQLIFSIICLGLSAFAVSVVPFSASALMVFVCVMTFIMSIYNIVGLTSVPKMYNYWAVLAFEIFCFIFWLVAFAYMAATAAVVFGYYAAYYDSYSSYYSTDYATAFTTLGAIMGAAAGVGALNWILFFISLVMHSIFVSRHRSAGLRNTPSSASAAVAAGAGVPIGGEKLEMQPQQQQQPNQMYSQTTGQAQQQNAPIYAGPPLQQGGYYPHPHSQASSPTPQSMSPPPPPPPPPPPQQQHQQHVQQPQPQYPQHSGQGGFPQPSGPYSADGSHSQSHNTTTHSVHMQSTGGSYVQGNPVAFPNSREQQHQQQHQPVHEAHGQSYDPHAPRELQ